MTPQIDHRELPPIAPFIPRGTSAEELEANIAYHSDLLAMFSTKGWRSLQEILTSRRDSQLHSLTSFGGVETIEEVYAIRQGLALCNELLGLEEASRKAVARGNEMLHKVREEG